MYCFDTNIIIDIFRGDESLRSKLKKIIVSSVEVFITPITLCELYKGAYLHHNPIEKIKEVDDFVSSFGIIDFTLESAKYFGKEYARLSKIGKLTSEFDLMIACITKINELVLITRDRKDFENVNVKLEIW
jgi:predicted nucleic acid-binding protein